MNIVFKVFGLEEQEVVRDVWQTNNGVDTETEMITYRLHQMDFDTEEEAIEYIINDATIRPEHGFEIVKVYEK